MKKVIFMALMTTYSMALDNVQAIVLAAGKSTRFKADTPKIVQRLCGREMILYVTKLLESLKIDTVIILGHQKELIQALVTQHHDNVKFVYQEKQLGTGHAVMCARPKFATDNILILNGDTPLITSTLIQDLYNKHMTSNADITFVINYRTDPSVTGYGRVVQNGNSIEIIEQKNFTGDLNAPCYINAGIYLMKRKFLEENLDKLTPNEKTKEFYITDLVKIANANHCKIETLVVPFDNIRGVNTIKELWLLEHIKRLDIMYYWMDQGVRFLTNNAHIDVDSTIGYGTQIGNCVQILGNSKIGKNCKIDAFCTLENVIVEDNAIINSHCNLKNTTIKANTEVKSYTKNTQ